MTNYREVLIYDNIGRVGLSCPNTPLVAVASKTAKVFHRDLKPKNILANADCK